MRVTIVLAAGSSRRWGAANKLLARPGGGAALAVRATRIARAAPAGRLIVVTGAQAPRVAAALRAAPLPRLMIVRARDHAAGLGASLRAGLAALWPAERLVFVFLGDMPAVPPTLARRLVGALRPGDTAVRAVHRGVPGHPVLLRRPPRAALAALRGDRGMAPLLGRARELAAPRGAILDLDRRTDCARTR